MARAVLLRDIFEAGLERFLGRRRLPLYLHKAAQAIRRCRTAALGGHTKRCPDGHATKVYYNSCGHRACPRCAYLKMEEWLARKRDRLLACEHFHFTFTLPSELYLLWRYNYEAFASLFFRCVKETLLTLLADPKFLGATPGILLNLHTWNRALGYCPHIHALVSGGGLAADGTWKKPRRKHLLSTDVPSLIYKAKFRDGLIELLNRGEIRLPADMNELDVRDLLHRALYRKWVVDRRPRYEHGQGVLLYLARYVRGGPLKESRLVSFDGEQVRLVKSRRSEPYEDLTVGAEDFIGRILMHVPPPYFRTVRCYGLYAPRKGEELRQAQKLLGQQPAPEARAEPAEKRARRDFCPKCGKEMVVVEVIPRPCRGRPPPRAAGQAPPREPTRRLVA